MAIINRILFTIAVGISLFTIAENFPKPQPNVIVEENLYLSADNTLVLSGIVNQQTFAELITGATVMDSDAQDLGRGVQDVYLLVGSPGGSVFWMWKIIDELNEFKHIKIHPVIVDANSAAFTISQFLGTRYIVEQGHMMAHDFLLFVANNPKGGENVLPLSYLERMVEASKSERLRYERQVAKRSNGKLTVEEFRDLYLADPIRGINCNGRQCIEMGFADKIGNIVADPILLLSILVSMFAGQ